MTAQNFNSQAQSTYMSPVPTTNVGNFHSPLSASIASGSKQLYEKSNCYSDRGLNQKNQMATQYQSSINGGFALQNANRKIVTNNRMSLIQQKQSHHISRTLANVTQASHQINRENILTKSNNMIVPSTQDPTPMQIARKFMKSKSPSRDEGVLPIIYHRKNNSSLYNKKGSQDNSARYQQYANTQESEKQTKNQNPINFNKTQVLPETQVNPTNFEQKQQSKTADKRVSNTSQMVQDLLNKLFPTQNKIFDHTKVLIQLKSSSSQTIQEELLLDKQWLKETVPHIRDVLAGVLDSEKVEITINCNVNAFIWIIKYLRSEDISMMETVDSENCLHLLVSSNFLGLKELYSRIWRMYFLDQFVDVINSCKMNLKNLNRNILKEIAEKISDDQVDKLNQRKDKFISAVYKAKSEMFLQQTPLYFCKNCSKLMTLEQSEKVNCHENENLYSYIEANGQLIMRHDIDQQIDHLNFITYYRTTYRICWKEFYLKVKAAVQSPLFCVECNRYIYLNELGNCKTHKQKPPLFTTLSNEKYYYCCKQAEKGFLGCNIPKGQSGCTTLFHQINIDQGNQQMIQEAKKLWLIIKEQNQDLTKELQTNYSEEVKFIEAQSMNCDVSLSEAYQAFLKSKNNGLSQAQLFVKTSQNKQEINDALFSVPTAQNIIDKVKKSKFKVNVSQEAVEYVRSRSPNQFGSGQIRLTLDQEANVSFNLRKRSLSPEQVQEAQKIAKKRIYERKRDIIFEDDQRSIKVLAQLLKQQRNEEDERFQLASKNSITKVEKKNSYLIDISDISKNGVKRNERKIILSPVEGNGNAHLHKRSTNSEKRKRSPIAQIKQTHFARKCSPT